MGCYQSCCCPGDPAALPEGQKLCRTLFCSSKLPIMNQRRSKVSGCSYMDNGFLVIVDANNHRVKLYDQDLKCCSFVDLEFRPYDVCSIGSQLFVTLPKHRSVQKLSVTFPFVFVKRKLRKKSTFKTEAECRGIVGYQNDLIASVRYSTLTNSETTESSWQIHILSTNGTVKRRFANNAEGSPLIHDARYICLTHDNKEIIISEAEDNGVKCLNIETGEITFNQHMEDPKGITCDKNSNIYVLGKQGSIRWILADRQCVKILLNGTKHVKYSNALTYFQGTHTLALPRNENKIDLYRVKNSIHDH
ncbi:uncharacterized protein LOC128213980 [Mya arenaria]|uniref:uncharacterized protein LOC128213980 n=1 Tax=Mya arenaria TaxID=6604 RepID=UPI0022E4E0AD|nr:uncharacterized protein LOC128213980 [Mya arenaria]